MILKLIHEDSTELTDQLVGVIFEHTFHLLGPIWVQACSSIFNWFEIAPTVAYGPVYTSTNIWH